MILPLLSGAGASISTMVGGVIALGFRSRITLLLALSTGVVLGISLLDLVPEAARLADGVWSSRDLATFMAVGFGGYMMLHRSSGASGHSGWRGQFAPAMLAVHSLMDGIGIGLAYRVDLATGSLVSMAVVAHDIADGLNIVTLGLLTGTDRSARIWLALDCTAPIVGVLLGLTVMPAGSAFGPILAVMAGGLLYVGASEMLPRLGTADARRRSAIAALSGMAFIYLVTG